METPVIYAQSEEFEIGGSKVLKRNKKDEVTVITAGITLHEALKAYELLRKENIFIRVIDLYSIKPLDKKAIKEAAIETNALITVEDHYPEGGLGEAVITSLELPCKFKILAVKKLPVSGKPYELLKYEGISQENIVNEVKEMLKTK